MCVCVCLVKEYSALGFIVKWNMNCKEKLVVLTGERRTMDEVDCTVMTFFYDWVMYCVYCLDVTFYSLGS